MLLSSTPVPLHSTVLLWRLQHNALLVPEKGDVQKGFPTFLRSHSFTPLSRCPVAIMRGSKWHGCTLITLGHLRIPVSSVRHLTSRSDSLFGACTTTSVYAQNQFKITLKAKQANNKQLCQPTTTRTKTIIPVANNKQETNKQKVDTISSGAGINYIITCAWVIPSRGSK